MMPASLQVLSRPAQRAAAQLTFLAMCATGAPIGAMILGHAAEGMSRRHPDLALLAAARGVPLVVAGVVLACVAAIVVSRARRTLPASVVVSAATSAAFMMLVSFDEAARGLGRGLLDVVEAASVGTAAGAVAGVLFAVPSAMVRSGSSVTATSVASVAATSPLVAVTMFFADGDAPAHVVETTLQVLCLAAAFVGFQWSRASATSPWRALTADPATAIGHLTGGLGSSVRAGRTALGVATALVAAPWTALWCAKTAEPRYSYEGSLTSTSFERTTPGLVGLALVLGLALVVPRLRGAAATITSTLVACFGGGLMATFRDGDELALGVLGGAVVGALASLPTVYAPHLVRAGTLDGADRTARVFGVFIALASFDSLFFVLAHLRLRFLIVATSLTCGVLGVAIVVSATWWISARRRWLRDVREGRVSNAIVRRATDTDLVTLAPLYGASVSRNSEVLVIASASPGQGLYRSATAWTPVALVA